jgi:hypothetical protein
MSPYSKICLLENASDSFVKLDLSFSCDPRALKYQRIQMTTDKFFLLISWVTHVPTIFIYDDESEFYLFQVTV